MFTDTQSGIIDVEKYISDKAKLWRASQIRSFFPLEHTPGMISLLAGKPNPLTFPFEAITLSIKSTIPDDANYDVRIENEELERALQYGMTGGLPDFVKVCMRSQTIGQCCRNWTAAHIIVNFQWLQDFQSVVHGRDAQAEEWGTVVGNGSQDLLTKVSPLGIEGIDFWTLTLHLYVDFPSTCQ